MSIHRVFAANLREFCLANGTIADVCKGAKVNRQQFNRYLSAAALPNAATMARICGFLGIRETDLFKDKSERGASPGNKEVTPPSSIMAAVERFGAALGIVDEGLAYLKSAGFPSIPEGYYYCYFPAQNLDGFLLRTMMRVRNVGTHCVFKRITLLRSPDSDRRLLAVVKHVGLVYSTFSSSYFIGGCTDRQRDISLLVIETLPPSSGNLRRGLGVVRGGAGPMACQVCIERIWPTPDAPRKPFEALGLVDVNDKSVNPFIRNLFAGGQSSAPNQISVQRIESALLVGA